MRCSSVYTVVDCRCDSAFVQFVLNACSTLITHPCDASSDANDMRAHVRLTHLHWRQCSQSTQLIIACNNYPCRSVSVRAPVEKRIGLSTPVSVHTWQDLGMRSKGQRGQVTGLLGPLHGAIAVPSVTRCRCRCRGHRCAGGARQYC